MSEAISTSAMDIPLTRGEFAAHEEVEEKRFKDLEAKQDEVLRNSRSMLALLRRFAKAGGGLLVGLELLKTLTGG